MKNENMLDTSNGHCYVYTSEEIKVEVLGGIRVDVLDRLRVTLKISKGEQSIRHNLDLYNDSQVERLVRKAAERLEIGSILAGRVMAGLTDELEKYRLQELEKLQEDSSKRMVLSDEETRSAIEFLRNPELLRMTNELIGQSGVIGEENNRLLMYLIFTSRKRYQPLHVISLGSSGTGKSHLQEKVGELIPPEDKIEITTLSQNAFYYFGRQELRNKLILIEDLDGAGEVLYPLRELQSKQAITKSLPYKNSAGETKTIHLRVRGLCVLRDVPQKRTFMKTMPTALFSSIWMKAGSRIAGSWNTSERKARERSMLWKKGKVRSSYSMFRACYSLSASEIPMQKPCSYLPPSSNPVEPTPITWLLLKRSPFTISISGNNEWMKIPGKCISRPRRRILLPPMI